MKGLNAVLFIALFYFVTIGEIDCLPRFIRGRRFAKLPVKLSQAASAIPELYFEQRLDHFNEANTQTWQQVI